jgi:F-type H+-transporting ATPase subunit gamma
MAGGQERQLRRRIRTVNSTKKITRAMELIAASRIVRAQQRVAAARPYSEMLTQALRNIASAGGSDTASPLLMPREEIKRVGFVVVTADRGLAGGYNSGVIRAAERDLQAERELGREYALILTGKKAESYFRFRGYKIDAAYTGFSEQPTYEWARTVADFVMEQFNEGNIDEVRLVYTQFLSVAAQRVVIRKFLPMEPGGLTEGETSGPAGGYEFEPEPDQILSRLLPAYVEARLFDAFLEAAASEQASRQRAMKAATDNANELIRALERIANRARQESITTEIMEIVGGAEALSQGSKSED